MSRVEVIGNATLYLGDCIDILPTLPKVDAVITDPPYGIGYCAQPTRWQRKGGKAPESWDDVAPVDAVFAAVRAGENAIVWGGNYFALPPSRGWLAWHKPDGPDSFADFELAWTSFDMNARLFTKSAKSASLERGVAAQAHPNQKPLALMAWCVDMAKGAQTILDPFMGSGTTGVAALQAGRSFIGIERELRYFDIACRRIEEAERQQPLIPHEPQKAEQMEIGT